MNLKILENEFNIVQLKPSDPIPMHLFQSELVSITKTKGEISIVCQSTLADTFKSVHHNDNWRAIMVSGVLDFSLTGVLASLTKPLADAEISVFAFSTYNTDYIMVKTQQLEKAIPALKNAGFKIIDSSKMS